MIDTASTGPVMPRAAAVRALEASGVLWFLIAVTGQWAFVYYIASFYGGAAARGNFAKWNEVLVGGFVAGGTIGNVVLGAHLLLAVVITIGGPLQLVPRLRARALPFHRQNGRAYLLTAFTISIAGMYMVWTRGTAGGGAMRVGISLNGTLIIACAAMAWRHARARAIPAHRRWALRTFVLVSGVWFFRVGFMFWLIANRGPVGIGEDFDGPFVRCWAFGCYLLPLAVLELYLRARDRAGTTGQLAMAGGLFVLTVATGVGILGAAKLLWLPRITGG